MVGRHAAEVRRVQHGMQVGVQVARGRADGAGALVQLARAVLVAVEQRAHARAGSGARHGGDAVGRVQARVLQSAAERAVGGQPRHRCWRSRPARRVGSSASSQAA